jgi:hypothetical protein
MHELLMLPPDLLLARLPARLWSDLAAHSKVPQASCLAACHSMRAMYAAIGLPSYVVAAQVEARLEGGGGTRYGSPKPRYNAKGDFTGHAVLLLPELGSFVDPTASQFAEVGRMDPSPVVGRFRDPGQTKDVDLDDLVLRSFTGVIAQPVELRVARKGLKLVYEPVDPSYADVINSGPWLTPSGAAGIEQNGLRLLANVIPYLNITPEVRAHAAGMPSPILQKLLDALTGAKWQPHDEVVDEFVMPDGSHQHVKELLEAFLELPAAVNTPLVGGERAHTLPPVEDPAANTRNSRAFWQKLAGNRWWTRQRHKTS